MFDRCDVATICRLMERAVAAVPLIHRATTAAELAEKAIADCRQQIPAAVKDLQVPGVTAVIIRDGKIHGR